MTDEIKIIQERAMSETTAHEAMETTREIAAIAKGEDPVRFLLRLLRDEANSAENYKDLYENWEPVRDLVQHDEIVSFGIGVRLGDNIAGGVRDFLVRYADHNKEMLAAAIKKQNAEIDAVVAEMRRR